MAEGSRQKAFLRRPDFCLPPPADCLLNMGNLGLSELVVIFIVALLVVGPKRLPEVARGLGEAFRSFQDALKGPTKGGPR